MTSRLSPVLSNATRLLKLSLLGMGLTMPPMGIAKPQALFSAPGSGRPVASYELSLPTATGPQVFQVPGDCDRIEALYRAGDAARDRIVDRRLWLKAAGDCRYSALLHGNDGTHLVDHLAGYDFDSLLLDDLPDGILCGGPPVGWCLVDRKTTSSSVRPLFPAPKVAPRQAESLPCRLVGGQLRAEVWRASDGLICIPNPRANVRLVGLNAADIDGDGIRDRILRLILISPELGRRTVRLPLTRLAPDAPLTVPGTVPVGID
jgi:hypothetical protein